MIDTLYREEILEHFRSPQHFGKPKNYTISAKQTNPFCGDEIEMYVNIGRKEIVEDIGFVGKGCAICIASTSILTEHIMGKSLTDLTKLSDASMLDLLAVEVSDTRKKCALLGAAVLRDCLGQLQNS